MNRVLILNRYLYSAKIIIFVFSSVFILLGCGGGGGGGGGGDGDRDSGNIVLGSMDISDAKMLIMTSLESNNISGALTSADEERDREVLYKYTEDGLIIVVDYYDDDGNQISSSKIHPNETFDLTEDYIFVGFDRHDFDFDFHESYYVRKSDGSVYKAPNAGCYFTEKVEETIADGNIYYTFDNDYNREQLNRIDISDPENLIDIQISPVSDICHGDPIVDSFSNVIYLGSTAVKDVVRLIKNDGSVNEISDFFPEGSPDAQNTFIGPDKSIYHVYMVNNYNNSDINGIYRYLEVIELLVDKNGNFATIPYSTLLPENMDPNNPFSLWSFEIFYLHILDKVIAIDLGYGAIAELYNESGKLYQPDISTLFYNPEGYNTIKDVQSGTNYYFLFGIRGSDEELALYRVNAYNHEAQHIDFGSKYEVYKINVISDDEVMFHALRYSDGADILGIINQNSEITILNEFEGHPSVNLVRVL